jgi:hypothetical protein
MMIEMTIEELEEKMGLPVNGKLIMAFKKYQERKAREEMVGAWRSHIGLFPFQCQSGNGCLEDRQEQRSELNFDDEGQRGLCIKS